jgi:two-component system, NtrC family, response regulator AtoC
MKTSILIIDDEELIRWSLKNALEKAGYEVMEVESGWPGLEIIRKRNIGLVILDMVLPAENGLTVLKKIKDEDEKIQVIMITAFGSIETAVEAIKSGADDYITKPFDLDEIVLKVDRALQNAGRIRELGQFKKIQENQLSKEKIIFKSQAIKTILDKVKKIGEANADLVLITGETGVGKGLIARSIHKVGSHAKGPFVTLNCFAIPENLLESELFGYERGAFTDAKDPKEGVAEQARGGTLFLDEIGDIPLKLQGKLLRFIEEKSIRRLGGKKEINLDLRLTSATNRDLSEAMLSGAFRMDLFHRLSLIQIHIPPLRERKEDIIPLAEFFLKQFNSKYRKTFEGFTDEALGGMTNYLWPGNVRELSNVIERITILENSKFIDRLQLINSLIKAPNVSNNGLPEFDLQDKSLSFEELVNNYKKNLIKMALEKSNNNKINAADLLKMDRSTFNYQIKLLKLR